MFEKFNTARPLCFVWHSGRMRITMVVERTNGWVNIHFEVYFHGHNSNVDLAICTVRKSMEEYIASYAAKTEKLSLPMSQIFDLLVSTGALAGMYVLLSNYKKQ